MRNNFIEIKVNLRVRICEKQVLLLNEYVLLRYFDLMTIKLMIYEASSIILILNEYMYL